MAQELRWSKHNIVGKVSGSEQGFVVNLLSRNADLLEPEQAAEIMSDNLPVNPASWLEKGYLVDPAEEQKRWKTAYLDFLDAREKDEVQIFFVPWYVCNFGCSYCFQEHYTWEKRMLNDDVLQSFFNHVDTAFAGKRKYLTLFGGEPFLPGQGPKQAVSGFFRMAKERGLDVAVITNGYTLLEYLDVLQLARIREVQVTLDGPPEIHDHRRTLKGGGESFARIAEGVDALLEQGYTVNLRCVVDRENLASLPRLAQIAKERGWTGRDNFKTQLGRNYELHSCHAAGGHGKLYSRIELWTDLHQLVKEHPDFLEFHKPAFSIARFLWEQGELPEPLFDACTGTKTEWAFDYQGNIYPCTAYVGKPGEELGKFHPQLQMNAEQIETWQERDVASMQQCRSCELQLACGGGCAAVAKNTTGKIQSPDCRPVRELLSMGLDTYFS